MRGARLTRILPKPNRRHDRPLPDRAVTDPDRNDRGGPNRCATTPSRLMAYGRVAQARLGRIERRQAGEVNGSKRSPFSLYMLKLREREASGARVADRSAPAIVAATVACEGGLRGIVAGTVHETGKRGQLGNPWGSALTCRARHGLRAVAISSRGWPNLLEVGRTSPRARAQEMGSCVAAGRASVAGGLAGVDGVSVPGCRSEVSVEGAAAAGPSTRGEPPPSADAMRSSQLAGKLA